MLRLSCPCFGAKPSVFFLVFFLSASSSAKIQKETANTEDEFQTSTYTFVKCLAARGLAGGSAGLSKSAIAYRATFTDQAILEDKNNHLRFKASELEFHAVFYVLSGLFLGTASCVYDENNTDNWLLGLGLLFYLVL